MATLIPVLWSRLPRLLLLVAVVGLLLAPALVHAQDLQPDPGPELLQPAAPASPANPEGGDLTAALLALAAALAALIEVGRRLVSALAQLRAVIQGVERADDPNTKASIKREAEVAGVQPALAKRVQKETA